MADSKYFGIPFATSGDKATIPEAVQPSGLISWTQGFGPDYERDPATDPLAKRVPRDETNEYLFQVTNAIKFLQLYGTPEWYPLDDAGDPVSYPLTARVRHDDGTGMKAWRSIVALNTAEPGTDPTKWVLDEAWSAPTIRALFGAAALTASTRVTSEGGSTSFPDATIVNTLFGAVVDDGQVDWAKSGDSYALVCQRAGRYILMSNMSANIVGGIPTQAISTIIRYNTAELFAASARLSTQELITVYGGGVEVRDCQVGDVVRPNVYQDTSDGTARTISYKLVFSAYRLTAL